MMREMAYSFALAAESEFRRSAKVEYYMAMYGSARGLEFMQDFANAYMAGGEL